jgi:phosphatidate phosphatase APP1
MLVLVVLVAIAIAYFVYRLLSGTSVDLHSDIKADEHVVFFNTTAWFDESSETWHLPIHGWIYEPQDSRARKAVFATVLDKKYSLAPDESTQANFDRRLNLLIADNERGKRIVVDIAGRTEALPLSAENGHFQHVLAFAEDELIAFAGSGLVPFRAVTADDDGREFSGRVALVEPRGRSILSDIDDTIKVSGVTDRRTLLDKTFLRDFEVVPGMAAVYRDWLGEDGSLHFVSSSPWQLYDPLRELIESSGFPWANLNLKPVRFRDETLFDLFKKGTETKPLVIKSVLDRYPQRTFVLVGDSGEQDPEVYADLLRERPAQIERVYIRNVSGATRDDERFTAVFDGIDASRWQLFDESSEMIAPGEAMAAE